MNHVQAPPFNTPVDYITLRIPDYPQKIKTPMDLGTIKKNIENGFYINKDQFICIF